MSTPKRRLPFLGFVFQAALLLTGCSILRVPAYLLSGPPMVQPTCIKLAPDEKDKEKVVKVLLLTSVPGEMRPEFLRIDREVAELLSRRLKASFAEKKENVVLMPVNRVDKFKDKNPDWRTWDLADIGKHFQADYVVDMEISNVSLNEDRSSLLYRGRMAIRTTVLAMDRVEDGPVRKSDSFEYPITRGPIPTMDMSYQQFRSQFVDYVAKRLSWYFVAHEVREDITCD